MLRGPVGALASDSRVAEAANRVLAKGSAVDGCVAAFLAAFAVQPAVLLGQVQILTIGPGVGPHWFDGSFIQPGVAAPRPRGYLEGERIPDLARCSLSSAVTAISTAHVHNGRSSMSEVAAPAYELAMASGYKRRAEWIKRVAAGGALALREKSFVRGVLDVCGRVEGGVLTAEDFESVDAVMSKPAVVGDALVLEQQPHPAEVPLSVIVMCACDSSGVLAVMHCAFDAQAIEVPEIEVAVSRLGVPVRRGVPRVRPQTRLPVAAPICILSSGPIPWAALAVEGTDLVNFESMAASCDGLAVEQQLRTLIDSQPRRWPASLLVRATDSKSAVRTIRLTPQV